MVKTRPKDDPLTSLLSHSDDPDEAACTIRVCILGTFFSVLLSIANAALAFRTNFFQIPATIAVLLSFPFCVFLSNYFPYNSILNPGKLTLKEHVIIYVIASTSGVSFGMANVVAMAMPNMMNNGAVNFWNSFAFVFVTNFLGYGLSGLFRKFLVNPTEMRWPGNTSIIALFSTFHHNEGLGFKTSRFRYFLFCFTLMLVYTWIPEYFFPVLQAISILCVFSGPGNGDPGVMTTLNAVAGSVTNGVGVLGLTFDWQYIGSINITSPFWAVLVNALGTIFFQWILTPWFFAMDVWGLNREISIDRMNPKINTPNLFCGNSSSKSFALGQQVRPTYFYNISDDFNLNITAYSDVSPVHITGFFALRYATSFLAISACLSHVVLWHGKSIWDQFQNALKKTCKVDLDIHSHLMSQYAEISDVVYYALLIVLIFCSLLVSLFTPFAMPWWAVFFNVGLCGVLLLPISVIQAISGFPIGLNVLTEFIIALMIPGETVAVMAFKSLGANNITQAIALIQDLKLGHYLHIPPRAMFFAQMYGTLLNSVVSTATTWFMMFKTRDLLNATSGDWQHVSYQSFYAAGAIWGAVGPERFFGIGSLYQGLLFCFPLGLLIPAVPWILNKYVWPSCIWQLINFPLFFNTKGPRAGYQNTVVVPLFVSWFFQVYLQKNFSKWYKRYAYVIASAFDSASAIAILLISFLVMNNFSFKFWNFLNPNRRNVPLDYYCYPGADYVDFGCAYYTIRNSLGFKLDPRAC